MSNRSRTLCLSLTIIGSVLATPAIPARSEPSRSSPDGRSARPAASSSRHLLPSQQLLADLFLGPGPLVPGLSQLPLPPRRLGPLDESAIEGGPPLGNPLPPQGGLPPPFFRPPPRCPLIIEVGRGLSHAVRSRVIYGRPACL